MNQEETKPSEKPIMVDTVTPLAAGGYLITWKEPGNNIQRNTFSRNPSAWIEGYKKGLALEELQKIQ